MDSIRWVNEASASGVGAATDLNTILPAIVKRIEVSDAYAIHRLDLRLAGRHSDYSTFGGNFTGKLGVRLQLAPELLLRVALTARAKPVPRFGGKGTFGGRESQAPSAMKLRCVVAAWSMKSP